MGEVKSFLKPDPELRNGYKDKKRLATIGSMTCIICFNTKQKQKHRTEVHHLIGCGLGKKASDLKTIPLCSWHHRLGNRGEAVHSGLKSFEANFGTQQELLMQINNNIYGNMERYP